MDWDSYYASFSRLMTEFLPIAHKTMIPRPLKTATCESLQRRSKER